MDFEDFIATYGDINDKSTGKIVKLKLNGAQRQVVDYLEECRLNKLPCRLLILKSRQLGISTVLLHYFTWYLIFHCKRETFLSLCHNKQLSKTFVNSMVEIYTRYNKEAKPKPTGESILSDASGNQLIYSSAKNFNSTRGYNIALAHLSESAFWHSKSSDWSEEVIRSVMGSVGNRPGTIVVLESTSDGKNNYFYKMWLDSVAGVISYKPLFLSWNLCEYYSKPLSESDVKWSDKLSRKEKKMHEAGITIEQLNWYRAKRKEFQDEVSFLREYPSTADECFTSANNNIFTNKEISYYRKLSRKGKTTSGDFLLWHDCDSERKYRYFVVVTIAGRLDESKFNVISSWRITSDNVLTLCCEKRYVSDIDSLILDSIFIARHYCNAMLIVETNNLNIEGFSSIDYYTRKLSKKYLRLYSRDGAIGYNNSIKRKMRGLLNFRQRIREKTILDYNKMMVNEMKGFILDGDELKHSIDSTDELIASRLILCDIIDEMGPIKPPLNPNDFLL